MVEFKHYGVRGMHWGIRKKRTPEKVFISGTSKMQSKESEYYREQLHESLTKYLDSIMNRKAEVLIGDCVGADSMVQEYLARNNYNKVHIYVSGNEVRNNADGIGSLAWKIHNIDASMYEKGTKEWHAIKDEEMSKKATSGLGIILDEGRQQPVRILNDLSKQIKMSRFMS